MYNRFHTGTNDIGTMNSCNTVFPRDIVCLRNISTNTLHTGDDDDDDDDDNNNNNNRLLFMFSRKLSVLSERLLQLK